MPRRCPAAAPVLLLALSAAAPPAWAHRNGDRPRSGAALAAREASRLTPGAAAAPPDPLKGTPEVANGHGSSPQLEPKPSGQRRDAEPLAAAVAAALAQGSGSVRRSPASPVEGLPGRRPPSRASRGVPRWQSLEAGGPSSPAESLPGPPSGASRGAPRRQSLETAAGGQHGGGGAEELQVNPPPKRRHADPITPRMAAALVQERGLGVSAASSPAARAEEVSEGAPAAPAASEAPKAPEAPSASAASAAALQGAALNTDHERGADVAQTRQRQLPNSSSFHRQRRLLCKLRRVGDVLASLRAWPDSASGDSLKSHWRARTCAVVSNSGVHLAHAYGREIDAQDMVIRFNTAPVTGYGRHVGTRTHMRVVQNEFWHHVLGGDFRELGNNTTYVNAWSPSCASHQWRSRHQTVPYYQFHPELYARNFQVFLQEFMRGVIVDFPENVPARLLSGGVVSRLTSGALGMLVALHLCDEVHAYGMAETPAHARASYHYFDVGVSNNHVYFPAERMLWRALALNAEDLDKTDHAVIPGSSSVWCEASARERLAAAAPLSDWPSSWTPHAPRSSLGAAADHGYDSEWKLCGEPKAIWCIFYGAVGLSLLCATMSHFHLIGRLSDILFCTCYLFLSVALDIVVKHESTTFEWPSLDPAVLVLVTEATKLGLSFALLFASPGAIEKLCVSREEVVAFLPSAVLYTINNIILFKAISTVDLTTFAVFRETSTLWSAAFWLVMIGGPLGVRRWTCLLGIFVGCLMTHAVSHGPPQLGPPVLWVLALTMISALAAVANERALKKTLLDINVQNCSLYVGTCTFAVLWVGVTEPMRMQNIRVFFMDLTWPNARVFVLQAILGLLVSRVLKYADVLMKQAATAMRGPVLLLLGAATLGTDVAWPAGLCTLVVAACSGGYVMMGPIRPPGRPLPPLLPGRPKLTYCREGGGEVARQACAHSAG